jgi:phospho-N-acetylmuramoyl-pentapeptide-transferase
VIVAAAVAFVLSLFGTPLAIRLLRRLNAGQPIRDELGLASNKSKRGTPTMGGLVFILATALAYGAGHIALISLPKAQLGQVRPTITGLVLLGVFVLCGAVGFIDDFLKVVLKNPAGLSARGKLLGQLLVGTIFGVVALYFPSSNGETVGSTKISFVKDIPWLDVTKVGAVLLFVLIVVFMSNAVNLTDGMDGLATGVSVLVIGGYALIGFWQYRHWCGDTGGYASNPHAYCYAVRDPLEIAMIGAAAAAACLGFLWSNTSPARIFMGDTGALSLGGLMAGLAIATHTALLLPIISFLLVINLLSVVIQIGSFRTTGNRVFRMSPLHYHFELGGWSELNVVVRFWIVAAVSVAIGLGFFYGDFLQHVP